MPPTEADAGSRTSISIRRARLTPPTAALSGSACTSRTSRCCERCSNASDCTTSPSRALSAHQRPKLELYGDTLFIVVRTASLRDRKIRCGETHIFAGRGYVVTVRHGSTTAYKEVRTRCEGAPKMLTLGEGFVVYSIMDFIVDNYFPILQELESEVDALEDAVFSRTSDRPNVERIYEVRHELLLLRRAVQPLQEMCNRMMRFDVPLIDQTMHPYFRDIQDHVIRLVESIDDLRDLLAASLEAHLLFSSVEQNNIIKIFSVAAVVLMPPTLIASIYGMNFKSMPELEWRYGYITALVLMVVAGRGALFVLQMEEVAIERASNVSVATRTLITA